MSKEKTKPQLPRDALVIKSILKEMGVEEYEPKVINQLLDFSYGYVTDVLEEARVYSAHAQHKQVEAEDVRLAVQSRVENSLGSAPPRELLLELARNRNSTALPPVKSYGGLRLPPDRYCLTAHNYRLTSNAHTVPPTPILRAPSRIVQTAVQGGRAAQGLGAQLLAEPRAAQPVVANAVNAVLVAPSTSLNASQSRPNAAVFTSSMSTVSSAPLAPAANTVNMALMSPSLTGAAVAPAQLTPAQLTSAQLPAGALKRAREPDADEYD